MGTDNRTDGRPLEDLTARARIRDAALAQFAEHGFKSATMKGVAQAAGYSTGLVQHHFGSKEGLRRACDAHVAESLGDLDTYGVDDGKITDPDFMSDLYAKSPLIIRYVARAMVEDSPAAASLFDSGAAAAERFLTGSWPERFPPGSDRARDGASVMAAMHMSTIALHAHLSRRMGADVLDGRNAPRIAMAMFDVYASMAEFTASDTGAGIRDAVAEQQSSGSPDEEHRDE
ncbi:AcrR family transcriptional regulator [Spinactinospora alkalitolerans]|uniref:AcrR family transcriptional regulator n=1 Tax=Spinactinospora alkalitolerans TaxID=687207 RepID=A0A852TRK5_9ACTN|nr:TetR/AcrR family transcriptional regulator [Spinactinospora alkalitolerans]NYE46639.1 AcrR family transcriptional regulator [Spinactinospora alkalitolerans]